MQSDQSTLPLSKDADELQSDFIIEGAVNEEEARRRREQLNRRPSYRYSESGIFIKVLLDYRPIVFPGLAFR